MKKVIRYLLFLIICLPISCYADGKDSVTLSNCVDANSARFMLEKSEIKVKFLGIDSSNIIYDELNDEINGSLVSDYVCSVLTNATSIELEYEPNSEKEDKFGRVLAWVYVDGVLLQENLVELGYSKVAYLYDEYKYNEVLKLAEQTAKNKKVGIWNDNNYVNSDNHEDVLVEYFDEEDKKSIFSKLLSYLNEIFEKLLDFIDNLINDVL